jgi:hypothetical protein
LVLSAFAFSLLCFLVPPCLSLLGAGRWANGGSRHLPLALAIHFAVLGMAGMLIARAFGFGPVQLAVAVALAAGVTALALRAGIPPGGTGAAGSDDPAPQGGALFLAMVVLAVLSVGDLAVIFSYQGWENEGGVNYFHYPMNDDGERNVVLVRALERDRASPFIPNADLIYPAFWHNLAALLLQPLAVRVGFPQVAGVTLATAVVFFIAIYAVALKERPDLARHWPLAVIVLLLTATHADLYNMALGLILRRTPGIEADYSQYTLLFFKSFSPKLVAIVTPQHASFMIFLLTLTLLRHGRVPRQERRSLVGECLLVCAGVVASPILAALTFPLVYGLSALGRFRQGSRQGLEVLGRALLLMLVAFAVFSLVYGFTPLALVDRPNAAAGTIETLGTYPTVKLLFLPLAFVGIFGVTGLLVSLWWLFGDNRLRTQLLSFWPLLLISGTLLFYYGISSKEINRHWSMVAATAGPIVLVLCLPAWQTLRSRLTLQIVCVAGVIAALLLHAFFVVRFTLGPSYVDPQVAWGDYLCMNDVIEERFPNLPVAAALGHGLRFPLAARVTISASFEHNSAAVHSRLDAEQARIEEAVVGGEPLIDHAVALGYAAVVWGPVEDDAWGPERSAIHARPDLLMAECGSVGLYRLPGIP